MSAERNLRIAHVQPQSLDLYDQRDEWLGDRARFFLTNLAEAQVRLGHEVTIHLLTSGRRKKRLAFRGVEARFYPCIEPPRRLSLRHRFARQFSLSLLRAVGRDAPDVVHFHGVRQFHLMYGAVARVAMRRGIPVVGRDDGYRPVGALERSAQRAGLRSTQVVIAANEDGVEKVAELGFPAHRIVMMPNGFDPSIFAPGDPDPPATDRPVRLLTVSRLTPEKDPLTLAEAVARLARQGRSLSLTIAGDGPLRPEMERILDSAGVEPTFTGHVSQLELAQLYRDAQVFCLATLGEGSSQSVVEAMASGLPVVAADVVGVRHLVDGVGELFPMSDPAGMADAISRIANSSDAWTACRDAGLKRCSAYTWEALARQVVDLYDLAIQSPRSPAAS